MDGRELLLIPLTIAVHDLPSRRRGGWSRSVAARIRIAAITGLATLKVERYTKAADRKAWGARR